MKRIIFVFSIVVMALVMGFVQPTRSSAMANCSKQVVDQGWLNASNSMTTISQLNTYAGQTLSLYLSNANPSQQVWFQIGSQNLTQTGSGTLSVTFQQATNNVVVKGGGSTIYQPNHYWMIWYELDSLTPCKPIVIMHP